MKLDSEKIKNFVYGVMVIISLIGGLYGSFKPETDARESHKVLAPVIDQVAANLNEQNNRIIALESKLEAYENVFSSRCAEPTVDYKAKEPDKIAAPPKRSSRGTDEPGHLPRGRPKQEREARIEPVQQRQKTYWED